MGDSHGLDRSISMAEFSQWIKDHLGDPFTIVACGDCELCERVWMFDFMRNHPERKKAAR